jgi:RimJ/RimL family protein N-acetyltransferase
MADAAPRPEQPTLDTARLRLRPFGPADAPAVRELAGAREVARSTLNIPHPYPDGAAEAWIAGHAGAWAAGTQLVCAVTTRGDGALVGAVGLAIDPRHLAAELGYWVGVPHWGRGYATEAARALCGVGFATLGLHRVMARHLTRNPASGRVMRKLGMRPEGVLREAVRKWDRFEDVALYAVLAPEWADG